MIMQQQFMRKRRRDMGLKGSGKQTNHLQPSEAIVYPTLMQDITIYQESKSGFKNRYGCIISNVIVVEDICLSNVVDNIR
jgi:hypothetical protein